MLRGRLAADLPAQIVMRTDAVDFATDLLPMAMLLPGVGFSN